MKYLCEPEVQHCGACPACYRNREDSKSASLACPDATVQAGDTYEDRIPVTIYECSGCKGDIIEYSERPNYCSHCGGKIEWGVVE